MCVYQKTLSVFATALWLSILSCPADLAQQEPGAASKTRLSRPGMSNFQHGFPNPAPPAYGYAQTPTDDGVAGSLPLPSNNTFSLGARQQQYTAQTESDRGGGLLNKGVPGYDIGSQNRDTPTFGAGLQKNGIPDLGIGLQKNQFPDLGVGLKNKEIDPQHMSVKLLANYDLELVVDKSCSMLTNTDCPNATTRWDWCGMQAEDLAQKLAPYAQKGFTVTAFAKKYYVFPNTTPQVLQEIFAHPGFNIGTHLDEPLEDRLGFHFANRRPGSKPLLLAVITDGCPSPKYEMTMVINTLVRASAQALNPHEISVVFFQIGGGDDEGRMYLHELDANLGRYGARYHIVHTVPFEHLQQVGLANALVESIDSFESQAGRTHRPAISSGYATR